MEDAGSVGLSVLGDDLGVDGITGGEKFGDGKWSRGAERGQEGEVRGNEQEVGDLEIDWRRLDKGTARDRKHLWQLRMSA